MSNTDSRSSFSISAFYLDNGRARDDTSRVNSLKRAFTVVCNVSRCFPVYMCVYRIFRNESPVLAR